MSNRNGTIQWTLSYSNHTQTPLLASLDLFLGMLDVGHIVENNEVTHIC